MTKLLVVLYILHLFCIPLFSQENNTNYKYWYIDSVLIWDDFQGTKNDHSSNAASSNCNIQYFLDIVNDTMIFEVTSFFDRSRSWKIKHKTNNQLLEHEQGHFNIAELYARKLKKELLTFEIPERHLTDTVKKIYENIIVNYKQAQNEYDIITKSGSDSYSQKDYFDTLLLEMEKLQVYTEVKYQRSID